MVVIFFMYLLITGISLRNIYTFKIFIEYFKDIIIYIEGVTRKEVFHPLVHFSDGHKDPGVEVRSFISFSHMCVWDP